MIYYFGSIIIVSLATGLYVAFYEYNNIGNKLMVTTLFGFGTAVVLFVISAILWSLVSVACFLKGA